VEREDDGSFAFVGVAGELPDYAVVAVFVAGDSEASEDVGGVSVEVRTSFVFGRVVAVCEADEPFE
jgi:hypothetical protein